MKSVVILDTYYRSFLTSDLFVASVQSVNNYQDSIKRVESLSFGTGASYVNTFRSFGWKADLIIPNSYLLQNRWSEQNLGESLLSPGWEAMQIVSRVPVLRDIARWIPYYFSVIENQLKHLSPDLILVQDVNAFPPEMIKRFTVFAKKIYCEIASPAPRRTFFQHYDRLISALPSFIVKFESINLPSNYLPLAFDERNAKFNQLRDRDIDVVFVGSIGRHQPQTAALLREIGAQISGLCIYTNLSTREIKELGLSPFFKGHAWGTDMFEILGRSKIVINRHGKIAENYAVNLRMFEATGCGALLVTEKSVNLGQLFDDGSEVVSYRSSAEAIEKIRYFLSKPEELEKIAKRGQQRTLHDHNYVKRVAFLAQLFEDDISC